MTINDFLDNSANNFPDKVGLVFGEKEYRYKEIRARANNLSAFLINKTKKGDVIALLMSNRPEMIFSYFGILRASCVVLLLPSNISDNNLISQANKINPKLIISEERYKGKFERTGFLPRVKYIEDIPLSKNIISRDVGEDDFSTFIFTSGTTAGPKGVKLRHRNIVEATKNIIEFLRWNENDIDINISPLSHSFGLGHIHCVFAVGGTTILFPDAVNIKKIIKTIIERKATTFGAVPAVLRLILNNYFQEFRQCGKYLRFVQTDTSSLEKELINKMFLVLPNTDFNYYYGLTEASRSTFITLNKYLDKLESVGRPLPGVEIKIVDGEICIKGKHVIDEYYENPEASKTIKQGWLFTGDTGYLDKDGYLYFKSRKDDIINVSGEKVWPEEIEKVVKQIPGVKDAAALAVPDRLLGEAVKVFISIKTNNFNPEIIKQECKQKLENYKVPKEVEIIQEIPRSESGKLKRKALKKYGQ